MTRGTRAWVLAGILLRFPNMAEFAAAPALNDVLDKLARFEATDDPVISLYLNLRADQHGKDHYAPFLRKEMTARGRTWPPDSAARASFDRDVERIGQYLADVPPSANGLAIFACAARDLFEAVLLDAPVDRHRLSVSRRPHLAPLELVLDRHPRHALVLADSHAARIFVVGPGHRREETVEGEPVRRSSAGGWSQARYQRHVEKLQAEHARELVRALDRLVRDERIEHVVLAGDEVNIPLVKNELSKELAGKVIDEVRLEAHAPEHEILRTAADALQRHDATNDAEIVESAIDAYRAGGLAAAGPAETLAALEVGQVDELYLTPAETFTLDGRDIPADEFVSRARQTSARVRFIEDGALLAPVGGVAAALRFRLDAAASSTKAVTP
jgi:peptide chain release factor subunit 1